MVTRKGKDEEQPVTVSIKEGMIEKTTEYKYLGMLFIRNITTCSNTYNRWSIRLSTWSKKLKELDMKVW